MQVKQIMTNRSTGRGKDYGIVNEWEDVLASEFDASLYYDNWRKRIGRVYSKLPFIAEWFMQTWKNSFVFMMAPLGNPSGNNKHNIVPCIIDFFLREQADLKQFYKKFSRNPLVLISSKEAYDFLIEQKCPLNIRHWALSISDKYAVTPDTRFDRKYDLIMLGRQNPKLMEFLEQYKASHPDLTYVFGRKQDNGFMYFDQDGNEVGSLDTREEYMQMMSQSRIGLYATPGVDGARANTNGFNQVTPRFLEYLVSGCHVITRYPDNSDTRYYELDRMSYKADTYEDFEKAMDHARSHDVDMNRYSEYLRKHYTSVRANELKKYLANL